MTPRAIAVVTGACGGMGRTVARAFGADHDLVLADIGAAGLDGFAADLATEGHRVTAIVAGDLAEQTVVDRLIEASGPATVLVHTAGLSPALAEWDAILRANLIATERLLRGFEQAPAPGFVAILIASMSAYMATADPAIDALLADPLSEDFLTAIEPHLTRLADPGDAFALRSPAYFLSKREVARVCERRSVAWGPMGARLVSISPGLIRTPMALREVENNPRSKAVLDATPVGRWGTPLDIAAAARFLASSAGGFITGCDLRVDGGVTPSVLGVRF